MTDSKVDGVASECVEKVLDMTGGVQSGEAFAGVWCTPYLILPFMLSNKWQDIRHHENKSILDGLVMATRKTDAIRDVLAAVKFERALKTLGALVSQAAQLRL